mgnify:CR=1 FL=1
MPTTSEETTIEYGPSISDFEKAKLLSQKKKLNPNRIGANFDHGILFYFILCFPFSC